MDIKLILSFDDSDNIKQNKKSVKKLHFKRLNWFWKTHSQISDMKRKQLRKIQIIWPEFLWINKY